ncbi:MAG TPA: T9SS type A sorting domain-containing protein [Bacteroidia bacterium]|nr:T9SS type A sorting domain-containing protein [Bacteroidia bacterium]
MTNLKYFILNLVLINLIAISFGFSQTPIYISDKVIGGNAQEAYGQLIKIDSEKFMLFGRTNSENSGNIIDSVCHGLNGGPYNDILISSIDTGFNIKWNFNCGGNHIESTCFPYFYGNGKIIFCSQSRSDSSCEKTSNTKKHSFTNNDYDFWLCMIDTGGVFIWDKDIGSLNEDFDPIVTRLTDDNILICGNSSYGVSGDKSEFGSGPSDFWVIKLDSLGNKIWDHCYGGAGSEYYIAPPGRPYAYDIVPIADGGFILSGTTNSPQGGMISEIPRGNTDIWIVAIDSAGNVQWEHRFGGNVNNWVHSILINQQGILIGGQTDSPQGLDVSDPSLGGKDVWLIQTDFNGNKLWDKRYGGSLDEYPVKITPLINNKFLISCTTKSNQGFDISEPTYGGNDYWVFEIDSAGNKLWDKRFGGPADDFLQSIISISDSLFILGGDALPGTSVVKTDSGYGVSDFWLVKFKISDTVTVVNDLSENLETVHLSPNPAVDIITLTVAHPLVQNTSIVIYDISGRVVYKQKFEKNAKRLEIDISSLVNGSYCIKLTDRSNTKSLKFVKLNSG